MISAKNWAMQSTRMQTPLKMTEVKAKTIVTAPGVPAGVVFIAVLGMAVMGYLRLKRQRSEAHTQPLYPLRGPSFV